MSRSSPKQKPVLPENLPQPWLTPNLEQHTFENTGNPELEKFKNIR